MTEQNRSDGISAGTNLSLKVLRELLDGREELLFIESLRAGYGKIEILHEMNLSVGRGQSLCLIGPNGAGKSTVLHSIYGLAGIRGGRVMLNSLNNLNNLNNGDITRMPGSDKLSRARLAYILQDSSVFPGMTLEENLLMGGYKMKDRALLRHKTEEIFKKYDRLAARRKQPAGVLSGGERRLLEIARALIMDPEVLLVDEPSIGLEPRYINMVFEILKDLQQTQGKTIIMVEQNAKKGLEFADIGYVLVAGKVALAGKGADLLKNPQVGKLFLGG